MRGEIGRTAIKRQRAPASTKSRDTTVAVLQTEQPVHSGAACGLRDFIHRAEACEREQRAGRVIRIGHTTGQIRPRPAAGRGVRVGMLRAPLLAKQPLAQSEPLLRRKRARRERFDGERCRPRREVRINRPAPVRALRRGEKLHALSRHDVFAEPHRSETHRHERRQRRSFEKAAIHRLDRLQHTQRLFSRERAQQACERIPRRCVVVNHLPNRNQRRQRVAHHRQSQQTPQPVRNRSQLKRQLRHEPPLDASRQRKRHQDRHRESAILSVTCSDALRECRQLAEPSLRLFYRVTEIFIRSRRAECRPTQRSRGDVRLAPRRVPPPAVRILMLR